MQAKVEIIKWGSVGTWKPEMKDWDTYKNRIQIHLTVNMLVNGFFIIIIFFLYYFMEK